MERKGWDGVGVGCVSEKAGGIKRVLSVCATGPHPGDLSPVPVLPIR